MKFESVEFTTRSGMDKAKKELNEKIMNHFNVERKSIRLQNDVFTLYMFDKATNIWFPITNGSIEMKKEFMKNHKKKTFKLVTADLQIN